MQNLIEHLMRDESLNVNICLLTYNKHFLSDFASAFFFATFH